MKKGFTMIELIFVIVILGILAAVAIPKLAATRDDANVAKALSEVSTIVADIGAYYTARGRFDINGTGANAMSNVADLNETSGDGSAGVMTYYTAGPAGQVACVDFNLTSDGNMTLSDGAGGGNICDGLQGSGAYTDLRDSTYQFGGSKVQF